MSAVLGVSDVRVGEGRGDLLPPAVCLGSSMAVMMAMVEMSSPMRLAVTAERGEKAGRGE